MNPSYRMLAAMALLASATACTRAEVAPPPSRPVDVVTVMAGPSAGDIEFSGTVEARHQIPLSFRVGGKIVRRMVDVGHAVAVGETLALLDASDLELEATRTEAQRDLAEAELGRFRQLSEIHAVSRAAVEDKEAAYRAASAQAALARNQVGYARLRAEAAGVVTATLAEPGQLVSAGRPVFTLALDGAREVAISIPEAHIAGFRIGDEAQLSLWADRGARYSGRLRELSAAADSVTRSYAARVTILEADARAALGMTARARFPQKVSSALLVPLAAVFNRDGQTAVWVVNDAQTVLLRPVTVASYSDVGARIAEGLLGGERVIVSGVHTVRSGEQVSIAASRRMRQP